MSILFFSEKAQIVNSFGKHLECKQMSIDRDTNYDCDAIISPANSLGEIQGGIDMIYYQSFGGDKLQRYIFTKIKREKYGELLIGDYLIIDLREMDDYCKKWPKYLILCPTMTVPENVSGTRNAYYFCYAMLNALEKIKYDCKTVWCPIPAVGVGKMDPEMASIQCRDAILARSNKGPAHEVHGKKRNVLREYVHVIESHGVRVRKL